MKRRNLLRLFGAAALVLGGCGEKAAAPVLAAGKPLPAFELPDLAGQVVRPAATGMPALLNFWATWCPPCRAEMESLERLYRRWRNAGLAMYGISIDEDMNLVREFVLQNGITFPVLHDRAGVVAQGVLALRNFPTTVLVGRDGMVMEVVVGERRWDVSPAEDAVRTLL